ncbi:MAG: hypothetical protein FK732_00460 [Asgard group archaeon]|nr:hypothetical protein [Asgard group archaeon]
MDSSETLDKFGQFIITNLRDNAIDFFDKLIAGVYKANKLQRLQDNLMHFSPEEKEFVRKCLVAGIDTAIHDFLLALMENYSTNKDIEVIVDGQNIVPLSKGLYRELPTKDGWFAKFSRYPIEF